MARRALGFTPARRMLASPVDDENFNLPLDRTPAQPSLTRGRTGMKIPSRRPPGVACGRMTRNGMALRRSREDAFCVLRVKVHRLRMVFPASGDSVADRPATARPHCFRKYASFSPAFRARQAGALFTLFIPVTGLKILS